MRYDGLLHIRGTNLSKFVALRRIAEHARDQSVAIGCTATDCCTFAEPICRNSLRCDRLLHFRRTNLSQFVALRLIDALSRDQSVAIRRATTDCCTFKEPICSNSSRYDRLLHFQGTNLSQLVVLRQIAAHSRDICRNSLRYDGLLHFPRTNLSQFVALRQITALSRDQFVAIHCATTDCCTFPGPICRNSSCYNRLLRFRGTNLSQIVALRQIAADSRDQSVAIRRATTDCCTCKGPICPNSSRYDDLLHFRRTNLSQFVALRPIAIEFAVKDTSTSLNKGKFQYFCINSVQYGN